MGKTYNIYMCYYESESKTCSKITTSTVNNLHIYWILDVTLLCSRPISLGAFRGSVPNFFMPPKFCCAQKSSF